LQKAQAFDEENNNNDDDHPHDHNNDPEYCEVCDRVSGGTKSCCQRVQYTDSEGHPAYRSECVESV